MVVEGQMFHILDLLSLYICAYISYYASNSAFFGALIFLAGFFIEFVLKLFMQRKWQETSKTGISIINTALLPAICTAVVFLSIFVFDAIYIVVWIAILLILRSVFTYEGILRYSDSKRHLKLSIALSQLIPTAAIILLLWFHIDSAYALRIGLLSVIYPAAVIFWLLRSKGKNIISKANYNAEAASYRLYNALLLNSNIALYLSMMSFIGILMFVPSQGDLFLPVISWVALVITITVVLGRIIRQGKMRKIEKNTLFIAGGIIWLFAHIQLNETFSMFDPSLAWIWSLLQAVGLAVMMMLATYMQEDMRLVLELTEDDSESSIITYRSLLQQIAFIVAGVFISVEIYFIEFVYKNGENFSPDVESRLMRLFNLLPLAFVLLSMFFALLQPVSRDIVRKLKLYREQKLNHSIIQAFEEKLKQLLVKRYRKPMGIKVVAFFLKPWFYSKVHGAEIVRFNNGPVIFVANHRDVYGPIVTNLYFPYSYRPWIENKVLSKEKIIGHIKIFVAQRIRPAWFAKLFTRIMAPITVWLLNSLDPIPVYRRAEMRQAISTFKLSVKALQEQDNLMIFPEDPAKSEGEYASSGVSPFFTGFVSVAKFYYKQTGKSVTFYPVYSDQTKRTISFGEGITYDPEGENETERICEYLMAKMNEMAE